MKKIYVCLFALSVGSSFAQKNPILKQQSLMDRSFVKKQQNHIQNFQKVQGDTLWMNGFGDPTQWTQTFGANHTPNTGGNPGWEIITSLPTNITSQQADYQWPATFSGSAGNFAFINSDLSAQGNLQDAYFAFNQNIDLSAAGSTSLYLMFSEYYRNFYDGTFVEVSNDGGATWVEFEVNPESEVPVNTNCIPGEVEVVNITPAIGGAGVWTNQVRIRFHYLGDWDWFWGVDDVKIVEAWENDIKVSNWYAATDISTTQGLDYYVIDDSQTSFPGLTFGAKVYNNGSLNQSSVAINAIATGGYNQTGTSISLNANATDSVSITTPYIPSGLGVKTIDLTSVITATDAAPSNNITSLDLTVSANEYSRDNGVITGAISNITNNSGGELGIGNIMDIFNNWTSTGAKLYLPTQATAAVGAEYRVEIYKWNGVDAYEYVDESVSKTVLSTTATWSTLSWTNGPLNLIEGDDILLLAKHTGGANPVRFGLAQNTFEGSVLGYTGPTFDQSTSAFTLSSPGAVMVRLTDDPTANISEVENTFGLNVYPNPANEVINVSLNKSINATISVVDVAGKVVKTSSINGMTSSINASDLTNGIYYVTIAEGNSTSTQKVVIKK